MMGQQETTMTVAALRRTILALTAALIMAAMMVLGAGEAMAKNSFQDGLDSPPGAPNLTGGPTKNDSSIVAHNPEGACVKHFGNSFSKAGTDGLTGGACPRV